MMSLLTEPSVSQRLENLPDLRIGVEVGSMLSSTWSKNGRGRGPRTDGTTVLYPGALVTNEQKMLMWVWRNVDLIDNRVGLFTDLEIAPCIAFCCIIRTSSS